MCFDDVIINISLGGGGNMEHLLSKDTNTISPRIVVCDYDCVNTCSGLCYNRCLFACTYQCSYEAV